MLTSGIHQETHRKTRSDHRRPPKCFLLSTGRSDHGQKAVPQILERFSSTALLLPGHFSQGTRLLPLLPHILAGFKMIPKLLSSSCCCHSNFSQAKRWATYCKSTL